MDTRDGAIYDSRELAELAGVPDADLVTGSREALEKLRKKLVFTKGSFKSVESLEKPPAVDAIDPHLAARGTDAGPRATLSEALSAASRDAQPPVRQQEK